MHSEKEQSERQSSATDNKTQASSESNIRPVDALQEDLDCTQSDDEDEEERTSVVFNGDLRCEHGL